MLHRLRRLFAILVVGKLKRGVTIMLVLSLLNSVLQALSLFSTLPYLTLVLDPSLVSTPGNYQRAYQFLGSPPVNQFLLFAGLFVLVLIIVSNSVFYYTVKFQMKLLLDLQVKQSDMLLRAYLARDYSYFLANNPNDLSKRILNDSFTVVDQIVFSVFNIITYGVMTFLIVLLLVFVNFYLTIVCVLVVGLFYGLFYISTRNRIRSFSQKKFDFLKLRFKVINELFRAIKDVKVNSLESAFRGDYNKYEKEFFRNHARGSLLANTTGLGMDVIVFGGIIIATLVILFKGYGISSLLPLLITFALAVYKIKPYAQMLFKSINLIQVSMPSLMAIEDDLAMKIPANALSESAGPAFPPAVIQFRNITFTYPGTHTEALRDVTLKIPPHTTTAFVGRSGAGKTTLADILLGLLKPDSGTIFYGDVEITARSSNTWHAMVGYVPQQITLLDKSIAANVALGVEVSSIDKDRVRECLEKAGLRTFIDAQPSGIEAMVGDSGVRISGGQKQRIGIARALYKSPSILVLDESTSALDGITEGEVMGSLLGISNEVTIVLIAHRFSTIRDCDNIVLFNNGVLVDQGAYTDLISRNEEFRLLSKENI